MKLATLFAVAGLATSLAQGPAPGNRLGPGTLQPSFDSLKTYLSLSDTQMQGLTQLMRQHRDSLTAVHNEIAQKQAALRTQAQLAAADPAAIGRLYLEIAALQKRAQDARGALTTQATNTLTPDQKTKLKALEAAAQLQDEIRQATMVFLLTPPEGAGPGPGFGPMGAGMGMGMRGGAGRGPGFGAGNR